MQNINEKQTEKLYQTAVSYAGLTGSDEAFLSSVLKLAPSRIVYISCGPETLARDLQYLTRSHAYRVEKFVPVAICNGKILNLPKDFNGKFVVEESYYEINGKRNVSPHLFLITEKEDEIVLYSYEIPKGEDKSTFSYSSMKNVDYTELKKSEKFTPAIYHEKDGIWEGGSTSQFSPVMTFKLWEWNSCGGLACG